MMDVPTVTLVLVMLVILALVFDFMNGFHDAANSIATIVSTGVLKPYQAVAWAAFFNFIAILLVEMKVAATVGKGIVSPDVVTNQVIFGALIGAIAWNVITWRFSVSSSSSHALVGGLAGAVIVAAGTDHVVWGITELGHGRLTGVTKILAALFLSPLVGFILGTAVKYALAFLLIGVTLLFYFF